jgi:hypothetical protein
VPCGAGAVEQFSCRRPAPFLDRGPRRYLI